MINYALEQEAEKAAWDVWIAVYPGFTEETFVTFADFKAQQLKTQPRKCIKTNDEIQEELEMVISQFEQGKRGETR